ncbi:2-amino-4-hydroxy-6-hydroxymethyldihydropteridine diphosphokinase [Thiosocius teredinicola]|uniref:2-amino-4-hydroxy-6- hydroxymethyldihydropteridine diphosphokinase n=1 Tax=Thiosocius teredinicola TaxID=1973002 RepID=UPI0009911662
MPRVWVSIGSNIDRENNIRGALTELRHSFGDVIVSPVYETPAVGFCGDAFFNLVVGFDTELPPARLHQLMREIEARHGRERSSPKFSSRTLDLDLLTYGDAVTNEGGKVLPRDEITRYAFVLAPLVDVAGDELHPELRETYRSLWERMSMENKEGLQQLDDPAWLFKTG